MATEPIDSLSAEIRRRGLITGNKVYTSTGTEETASTNLRVSSSSTLEQVVPVTATVSDNTAVVFDVTAKGLEAAITGSVVYYGGSTVTSKGALRVLVTDSTGIGATTGYYYIPFGTLA